MKPIGSSGETAQQQYDKLASRIIKAAEWLDDPIRTPEEVEKWFPEFKKLLGELTKLERMMRDAKRGIRTNP